MFSYKSYDFSASSESEYFFMCFEFVLICKMILVPSASLNQITDTILVLRILLVLTVAVHLNFLLKGRMVEIYGQEASGKTTLALHVIREAQKLGGEIY